MYKRFPQFSPKIKISFLLLSRPHAGILFKNHRINVPLSFGTCGVTGTGSLCTPAPKRIAGGRTGPPAKCDAIFF